MNVDLLLRWQLVQNSLLTLPAANPFSCVIRDNVNSPLSWLLTAVLHSSQHCPFSCYCSALGWLLTIFIIKFATEINQVSPPCWSKHGPNLNLHEMDCKNFWRKFLFVVSIDQVIGNSAPALHFLEKSIPISPLSSAIRELHIVSHGEFSTSDWENEICWYSEKLWRDPLSRTDI